MAPEKIHKIAAVYGVSRSIPETYQERPNVDDVLVDNLTRDKHVIIYGSSKQGKTCLRRHCLVDDDYIVVQCQNNWTLGQLQAAILKNAGYEVEVSSSTTVDGTSKLKASFSGSVGLPGLAKGAGGVDTEVENGGSTTRTNVALQLDQNDPNDLVRALKEIEFSKYIVLEDFHYLPQETQEAFSFALKTVHETSEITFIIVAVWREENRLILYNGDLTGRVISVDADLWSTEHLLKVINNGECLLNIQFPERFKSELVNNSFNNVFIVQDCCHRACKAAGITETTDSLISLSDTLDAKAIIRDVISEQGARYNAFLVNFAAGFQDTQLQMYKWILYPLLCANVGELNDGLTYRRIRNSIESKHPEGRGLNPGNITQALYSVPALQSKKNIKPFVLDYDRSNLRLSVVDKGFLIWLATQDSKQLLDLVDLPTE